MCDDGIDTFWSCWCKGTCYHDSTWIRSNCLCQDTIHLQGGRIASDCHFAQDSEDLPWLLGFLRHCASFFACICLFQQRMIIIKMIEASIQIMNVGLGGNGCFDTTSIPNHSLSIIAMLLCLHLQIYPMELLLIRSTFLLMGLPASYLGGFLCRACINFQFTLCRHVASLIARIIRSFWCENHIESSVSVLPCRGLCLVYGCFQK